MTNLLTIDGKCPRSESLNQPCSNQARHWLSAAEQHGYLRYALRQQPIGERDLLIASIAKACGLGLVTSNTSEFRRVPGLAVEDWSS